MMLQTEKNIRSLLRQTAPVTPESGISTPEEGFHSPSLTKLMGGVNLLSIAYYVTITAHIPASRTGLSSGAAFLLCRVKRKTAVFI
jgi:hypothetical protein